MKNYFIILLLVKTTILLNLSYSQKNGLKGNNFPIFKGVYFGQTLPAIIPEIFAPGIVSTGMEESTITFTPDGKECYWTLLKRINTKW